MGAPVSVRMPLMQIVVGTFGPPPSTSRTSLILVAWVTSVSTTVTPVTVTPDQLWPNMALSQAGSETSASVVGAGLNGVLMAETSLAVGADQKAWRSPRPIPSNTVAISLTVE